MRRLAAAAPALSPHDAGYLARERDGQPMHYVLLCHLGPGAAGRAVTLEALRAHVAARLHRAPELRTKVHAPPLGIGPLRWVDDRSFRLERHVLPWPEVAAGEDPFEAGALHLTERRLAATRPLWELRLAPPRPDGSTVMALAVHHALMDGGLVRSLLDRLFPGGDPAPAAARTPA